MKRFLNFFLKIDNNPRILMRPKTIYKKNKKIAGFIGKNL